MQKNRLTASMLATALLVSGFVGASSEAQAAERKVVVWAPFSGGNLDMWKAAVSRIEKANPGLTVELVGSVDMEKSLAAINAGTGPDISVANGVGNVGWFCGTGAWQNLNKLIADKKVGINLAKTFTPAANNGTIASGVRCALPFSSEIFGFYYNKDLLKAAGFKAAPKTTAQLLTMAKKLTTFDSDGNITRAGYVPWAGYSDNDMGAMTLGWQFGAQWFSAKGKSTFASDPAWKKAFNWQKKFIADVYGKGDFAAGSRALTKFIAAAGDFWGGNNDFIKGRVAMLAHADWMSMMWCDPEGWNLNPCTTPAVNFGTAPLPVDASVYKKLYGSGIVSANPMGISKGSKNVKDAWLVLKAIATDQELALDWSNVNGDPASLLKSRDNNPGLKYPAFYKTFYNISRHPMSGYHTLLNTGEHLEESGLQSLMAAWQAATVPDISAGLKDLATRVDQMIARNG